MFVFIIDNYVSFIMHCVEDFVCIQTIKLMSEVSGRVIVESPMVCSLFTRV